MIILKKHNERCILFNTEASQLIHQVGAMSTDEIDSYISLSNSEEAYNYTVKEYLDIYFEKDHIIFENFEDSDFYTTKKYLPHLIGINFEICNRSIEYIDCFIKSLRPFGYFKHRPYEMANNDDDNFQMDSVNSLSLMKQYIYDLSKDSKIHRVKKC